MRVSRKRSLTLFYLDWIEILAVLRKAAPLKHKLLQKELIRVEKSWKPKGNRK